MIKKYEAIAQSITSRVVSGDYATNRTLSERKIAAEASVSESTARRSIQLLLDNGVLVRTSTGRLTVNKKFAAINCKTKLALVCKNQDVLASSWYHDLNELAKQQDINIKLLTYDHADDPIITESLSSGFDIVFLTAFNYSQTVINKMINEKSKVVSLFADLSSLGITSLPSSSIAEVRLILDYLIALGHEKIAFINTYTIDNVISSRAEAFKEQMTDRSIYHSNLFLSFPVAEGEAPISKARECIQSFGKNYFQDFSAIVCSTMHVAFGVVRGLYELGINVGKDISVAAIGNPELAKSYIPTITTTGLRDCQDVFMQIISDCKSGKGKMKKTYLAPPPKLFIGESTVNI